MGITFVQLIGMKRLSFYVTLLCTLFASCQTNANKEDDNGNATSEGKRNVSKRDYSINRSNSYSTLFLDSTAMEKFITDKKISDSVARRMRSFYNTRNYQFAWFSGDGLTEQALAFWNLHDYVATYDKDTTLRNKALQKRMDILIAEENLSVSA